MILNNIINIKIHNKTISYYKQWYNNIKIGDVIDISIEHLQKNSAIKVLVKCDICDKERELPYYKYNKNISKYNIYTCNKCFNIKNKKTNIIKYGDENFNNKEKIRKTVLEKYNVDNVSNIPEIKLKKESTTFKNYSVLNPMQNEETKLKVRNKIKRRYLELKKIRNDKTLKFFDKFNIISISNDIYTFKCDCNKEHNFDINSNVFYNRKMRNNILCTICNPIGCFSNSGLEIQLQNFIKQNFNNEIILNVRNIINPYELDIYLPDLKIAFEFNGIYWHNELYKDKNYHLNKTELCEQQGIQLIHIWEDDWIYKQEIVKSMILNKLNQTPNKIFARKTIIKEISDNKLVREFLDKNHIQGFVGSKIKLGLFYDNELVSLMTFGNRRVAMGKKATNKDEYELLRFCNKLNTNVIGGASKLFKYFVNNYKPLEITTYADRSISQGKLYKTLGFKSQGKTEPNYYYIIDGIRKHRFNFRKDILVKQGFDKNKTEHQIMLEINLYRIYDSGNLKFNYIII